MHKAVRILVVVSIAASLIPAAAQAQTVQQVLDKFIEAQGGRAALAAIKDMTYTGTAEMVQFGMSGGITMHQKEPNKMRMDIEVMGMVITQAFDGEAGWYTNPQTGTEEAMTEQQTEDMKHQSLGNSALLNPDQLGITYALKPKETLNGNDYLVLEQAFKDGRRSTLYIDPATYLVYKTKTMGSSPTGEEMLSEVITSDYEKEGDLLVAKSITIFQAGQEFIRVKFSKVAFNSGLTDDFFTRSAK